MGLCPECLIKSGFNTGTEPGQAGKDSGFVPPPVEEIRQRFPQLEIIELIGKGGMGAVYKARQPALDRFVALKILPPGAAGDAGFAERFNREARALARLSHPHIVAVHDFGQLGGQPYLVMEFVDGANLRQVEQAGRLAPEQALQIVPQICEALQFAHNEGIVHRDIKPENILIDKKGRVKITDFGIAKILGTNSGKVSLTGAKDVVGTPHYMAPEQVEKPSMVDHRADIYSLGVVFYEMLTGELPLGKFAAPSKKVQVDVRLDEVVLRTLEKEPELRYQQASEVKTQVETIATSAPGGSGCESARPEQPSERTAATTRSNAIEAMIVFGGTVFFLFLLALVGEMSRATAFRGFLAVMSVVGLVICALSLAGIWPFPSPFFPEPNFSSRNLRRQKASSSSPATEPRFSRTAIVGACWSIFGILAALFTLVALEEGLPGRTPTRVGLFGAVVLVPLGLTSIFGTTILGWTAVSQIRGSAGRLYGLGLAVFDGLLFPLLLLDALVFVVLHALTADVFRSGFLIMALIVCLVLDWRIAWWVWWKANQPLGGATGSGAAIPRHRATAALVIAAIVVIGVLIPTAMFVSREKKPASVADSPQKLRGLPNGEVILAGLAKPDSPWAWQELEKRAKAGQLETREAMALLEDLTGWMSQTYPNGYDQPLHWLRGLLDELGKRQLVTDEKKLAFLEAFYGKPTSEPLLRVRENEPQSGMSLTCQWRNPWTDELFGLKLLNEMRSITIDGKEANWRNVHPNCEQYEFYGYLELPALAAGKHSVRFEIESALIPKAALEGFAQDTLSEDWPSAKRRWTRICESELVVYPQSTQIVTLTDDPALDPVVSGALSVNQVIIRPEGNRPTAVVPVEISVKDKTGQKLLVPISFDVTLRVAGKDYRCGHIWSATRGARGGFTPNSGSRSELYARIQPPDAELREAEVVLTPNPKAVERLGSIDRIWGREIVFPHVRLVRKDLHEGDEPFFGPVIERVVNDISTGRDCFLNLDTGEMLTPKTELGDRWEDLHAWATEHNADVVADEDGYAGGQRGLTLFDGFAAGPHQWDEATAESVIKAVRAIAHGMSKHPSPLPFSKMRAAKGTTPVFIFKTRQGRIGILQILALTDDPRGVKIRYKLVQQPTRK